MIGISKRSFGFIGIEIFEPHKQMKGSVSDE
jgi:hypothetical protein